MKPRYQILYILYKNNEPVGATLKEEHIPKNLQIFETTYDTDRTKLSIKLTMYYDEISKGYVEIGDDTTILFKVKEYPYKATFSLGLNEYGKLWYRVEEIKPNPEYDISVYEFSPIFSKSNSVCS